MAGIVDFTNEEEVKEYLDNVEIEFMYGCNKEKNEDSCYRFGEFLDTIRKNFDDAAKTYKDCCDFFRSAPCCYKAGQFHMLGKGGLVKSTLEAYESYCTACAHEKYTDQGKNDRIAASCCNVGLLLTSDESVQQRFVQTNKLANDSDKSEKMFSAITEAFKRACAFRDASGCGFLSQLYMSGFEGRFKDMKLAAKFAESACELGDARSCHNLTVMYRRGDGVKRDADKSDEFAKRRDEILRGNTSLNFSQS